jgi:hypothetical protein
MDIKEQQLENKEKEVLKQILGESPNISHIQRKFTSMEKRGEYLLIYEEKKLGTVKYSFDNNECILIFDPDNKYTET